MLIVWVCGLFLEHITLVNVIIVRQGVAEKACAAATVKVRIENLYSL